MRVDYRNLPEESKELKKVIDSLPMPLKSRTMIFGVLMRADIISLAELKEYTPESLLRLRNFGKQTINIMSEYGLLKDD